MSNEKYLLKNSKIADFRLMVLAPILMHPPERGELLSRLRELAEKQYQHPITHQKLSISVRTLERWYRKASAKSIPRDVLLPKTRKDIGTFLAISSIHEEWLLKYRATWPRWTIKLTHDNMKADFTLPKPIPSYSTVLRFFKSKGLYYEYTRKKRKKEIRSYEVSHVGSLWHLDFHKASFYILDDKGEWKKPICLAFIDDHSRLVCHVQWFFQETTQVLVHGLIQAMMRRGMPRAVYSDCGSAMKGEEFLEGLSQLGITQLTTLPYSPHQNGKQEAFWKPLESRCMAQIPNDVFLDLATLNKITLAYVELDYQKEIHQEIKTSPLFRYLNSPSVLRNSISYDEYQRAFMSKTERRQRMTDHTILLDNIRFEIPQPYHHILDVMIRYARWNPSVAYIADPSDGKPIVRIFPINKEKNAEGYRNTYEKSSHSDITQNDEKKSKSENENENENKNGNDNKSEDDDTELLSRLKILDLNRDLNLLPPLLQKNIRDFDEQYPFSPLLPLEEVDNTKYLEHARTSVN